MEKKALGKQDEHINLTYLKDSNVELDSTVTREVKECVAALDSNISSDAHIHVNDGRKDPLYINLDTGNLFSYILYGHDKHLLISILII